jgi:hypothetical protein
MRVPVKSFRWLGLAAALLVLASVVARADPVRVRVSKGDGFGRITFNWPSPVPVSADILNSQLVVRFGRPVESHFAGIPGGISQYIGRPSLQNGGHTVVFPLRGNYDLNYNQRGRTVTVDVVDLEPPPRAAPAAAASAPGPARTAPAAPRRAGAETVGVRTGAHADYQRLVFDWNRSVGYKVGRRGNRVDIVFARPAQINLGRVKRGRLANVPAAEARAGANETTVTLSVPSSSRIRHFKSGARVVVDIYNPTGTNDARVVATKPANIAQATSDEAKTLVYLREENRKLREDSSKEKAHVEELKKQVGALAARRDHKSTKQPVHTSINFGSYHALVIGINRYHNVPRLRTAVADAEAIAEVLKSKYGFTVTSLINPTREQIFNMLDGLRAKLKSTDNLLIYYAGHGVLDEKADEGFWLPVNARSDLRSQWVSNATITNTLKAIEAKHVMVIADSCYSGRLVRGLPRGIQITERTEKPTDYFTKMSRKKARVVITSGGLEPVEDGRGEHSPFTRAILNALNDNDGIIDGSSLFHKIRRPVMLAADQTPQYSDVRRAGHDGGDFLFVRRK